MRIEMLDVLKFVMERGAPVSRADVADILPGASASITRLLAAMVHAGYLARVGHGRYQLGEQMAGCRIAAAPRKLEGCTVLVLARYRAMLGGGEMRAIEEMLAARGVTWIVRTLENQHGLYADQPANWWPARFDGILAVQHRRVEPWLLNRVRQRGIPLVQAGSPETGAVDTVAWDEFKAFKDMALVLLKRGCDALAYLQSVDLPHETADGIWRRLAGAWTAAQRHAASFHKLPVTHDDLSAGLRDSPLLALLERSRQAGAPLGIVCASEAQTVPLVSALESRGWRFHEQVLACGSSKRSLPDEFAPYLKRLTVSVAPPTKAIGRLAAQRLLARLDGDDAAPLSFQLGGDLTLSPEKAIEERNIR